MFRLFDNSYQAMNPIIEEGGNTLWLGDFTAALDRTTLEAKSVRTVLTVAQGLNIGYPDGTICHKVYSILDMEGSNIAKYFADSSNFISDGLRRGSVLVHCAAGVSRSATIVIAYLMRTKGMGFQEAMNFVKKRRGVICPNYGFQRQLRNFEKDLKDMKKQQEHKLSHASTQEQFNKIDKKLRESQICEIQTKPLLKPLKQEDPNTQQKINQSAKTPMKDHRKLFNSDQKKQIATASASNRSNSTQPKFLLTSTYNSTYVGPQIVTHQRNKLYDQKTIKQPLTMPGINLKQQYQGYRKY